MGYRKSLSILAATVAVSAVMIAGTSSAQERVKWKMHSAWGSSVPHLGTSGVRFSKNIERLSGGSFTMKFFEPGALIPANEGFDATSKGSIEAAWSTAGYDVGKYPALAFFTAVPFGPSVGEYFAWKKFGGGDDIQNEIYAKHNIHRLDCFAIGPETSGWFKTEIKELEQLRGMKRGRPRCGGDRPGRRLAGRLHPAARAAPSCSRARRRAPTGARRRGRQSRRREC